jgi:hypothetical protein
MQTALKETVIDSNVATNHLSARHCYIDATTQSSNARKTNSAFFNADHMQRVARVKDIADKFFPVKDCVYVNHRNNRGKPFTVVKVSKIGRWPANKNKQTDLYAPLAALGVTEVLLSGKSNSYLFRLR